MGKSLSLLVGTKVLSSANASTGAAVCLEANDFRCFLANTYAAISTTRKLTLYRWYDEGPAGTAQLLGKWWSPRRPSAEIDKLGLSSLHKTSRADLAIKHAWSKMHCVVEAQLQVGAHVFVGRIAGQVDDPSEKLLGGGYVQFLIPTLSRGALHLLRTYRL